METNALNYVFATILLIITEKKEIYLVTFYFHIFKIIELNYDIYDKELLVVFEAFYTWHYYLEDSEFFITNHKNPEYFSTTKILSHY